MAVLETKCPAIACSAKKYERDDSEHYEDAEDDRDRHGVVLGDRMLSQTEPART